MISILLKLSSSLRFRTRLEEIIAGENHLLSKVRQLRFQNKRKILPVTMSTIKSLQNFLLVQGNL